MSGLESNPDVLAYVDRILPEVRVQMMREDFNGQIMDIVFDVVFDDAQLKIDFEGAEIRRTTMCGAIAKNILRVLDANPEEVNLLAIGDVTFPDFMMPVVKEIMAKFHENFDDLTDPDKLDFGYDLAAKGYKPAREIAFKNWNKYYGFSDHTHPVEQKVVDPESTGGIRTETVEKNLMDVLIENSTITPGGMHILTVLTNSFNKSAVKKGLKKRYVYPDNSFGTWKSLMTNSDEEGSNFEQISTDQKDKLHLTPEKIHQFYDTHEITDHDDTWYITPVGNPSGTAMTGEQLTSTCEAILERNPAANMVLDIVYLRTMEVETTKELIGGIISNPKIMDRALFIESLSKTHGIPGLRVGMFFSANKKLYDSIQNADMLGYAGHGHHLSALMMAFLDDPDGEYEAEFKKLHRFWGRERKGLYEFLIKSGSYSNLFDDNQDQVQEDQLDEPLGLYLYLKMREGVTAMQIYKETGCIGVESVMGSGKYMRFSVGKITEPTYSKEAI